MLVDRRSLIHRSRRFGVPAIVTASGVLGMAAFSGGPTAVISALFTVGGLVWLFWGLYQLRRWRAGTLDVPCHVCAGPMRHLETRLGSCSRCLTCGAKREGHH
ncbi:hypothetical protein D9M68_222410 [compost metagenome]